MRPILNILLRTLVKPFYRQNAPLFLFIMIVMFGVIGELNGADTLQYHEALIRGMLSNSVLFIMVVFAWLFYANKCVRFVTKTLHKADHTFLNLLASLNDRVLFNYLLMAQLLMFLPITLYSLAVVAVALLKKWYFSAFIVVGFNITSCVGNAWRYRQQLYYPGREQKKLLNFEFPSRGYQPYFLLLLRYILNYQKLLLLGLKLYDCAVVYLISRNFTFDDYDITMPSIFLTFGILGHAALVYGLRKFEEQRLDFYRSLPFSLSRRFTQYLLLYLILLLPEVITITLLTPTFLRLPDAVVMMLTAYGTLLLLNSLLFIRSFKMLGYVKLSFVVLCIEYLFLLVNVAAWLPLVLAATVSLLFYWFYYRHEKGGELPQ